MPPEVEGPAGRAEDVLRLGPLRPPLVYLAAILIGLLLQRVAPLAFVPAGLATPLGASLVGVAIALLAWAVALFRAAGTPVPARQPTTAIVRTGPYRVSRNPIYLAFSLAQLGIAVWSNSLWLLLTLLVAVGFIHYRVILGEEAYLERRFGAEYLDYKRSVRRWL